MVAFSTFLSALAFATPLLVSALDTSHVERAAIPRGLRRRFHAKRSPTKSCAVKHHVSSSSVAPTSTAKIHAVSTKGAKPTSTHRGSTATTRSSASEPSSTGTSDDSGSDESTIDRVFNGADLSNAVTWSTIPSTSGSKALSDSALNIYWGTKHTFTTDVSGLQRQTAPALRAFYQKGSTAPGHSGSLTPGLTIYAKTTTDLTKGNEVMFSYKAYFPKDFNFVHGGKMPGLYGGTTDKVATTCSGGRHNVDCFSIRMMWRDDGEGELYSYLPPTSANLKAYQKATKNVYDNNGVWGVSVGRGLFKWKRGDWTQITQRVKLNDIGKQNGELEIMVDGKTILNVPGLSYRTNGKAKVRGAQIETFFGGHDASYWATPKDQYSYFKDFATAILN